MGEATNQAETDASQQVKVSTVLAGLEDFTLDESTRLAGLVFPCVVKLFQKPEGD